MASRAVENDETGAGEEVRDMVRGERGPVCQDRSPHEPPHRRVDRATSYHTPCTAFCAYMDTEKKDYFGGNLQEFWESLPECPDACCHWKSFENVKEKLKQRFPKLKSATLLGLKKLLCADFSHNGITYPLVKLENFLRLIKCFGPFVEEGTGQCYTLKQFEAFLEASARKNGTSKISWFAGDISRENAEEYLDGQRKGTYLLRLSQTEFGAFALSVVAVEGEIPLHIPFKFQKDSEDQAEYIWFKERKYYSAQMVIKHCMREPFDDDYPTLRLKYECPNLPFNRVVTGYRGRNK